MPRLHEVLKSLKMTIKMYDSKVYGKTVYIRSLPRVNTWNAGTIGEKWGTVIPYTYRPVSHVNIVWTYVYKRYFRCNTQFCNYTSSLCHIASSSFHICRFVMQNNRHLRCMVGQEQLEIRKKICCIINIHVKTAKKCVFTRNNHNFNFFN